MGLLDSCMFGSADDATDPALSSVVIDDGEGAGGSGGGNGASKDLLSASLAESGILNDAVGDGVVSLGGRFSASLCLLGLGRLPDLGRFANVNSSVGESSSGPPSHRCPMQCCNREIVNGHFSKIRNQLHNTHSSRKYCTSETCMSAESSPEKRNRWKLAASFSEWKSHVAPITRARCLKWGSSS